MKEEKNPLLASAETALTFEEAMKEYIAELDLQGRFNIKTSYSHFTLRRLNNRFGREAVQGWLNNHFDNK